MSAINVYLIFNGKCSAAMNFYKDCLGGELTLQTVGESPMASQWPAEVQNNILHARLERDGLVLLGSDMGEDGEGTIEGNTMCLSLTCDTRDELETCFNNLSVEGNVIRPLHDFFAGTMGVLIDKYGKNWMFYCEN